MRIYRLIPLSALWLSMLACSTVSTFSATPTPTAPPLPTLPPAAPTASPIELQLQTLDVIDQVVTEAFVREDLDGVPWADEVAAVRAQVGAGLDAEGFDVAIHDLVDRFPNDAVQFLSRAERIELEANASTTYQGIGVYFGVRGAPEPRVVVLSVIPGSPAEAAGLEAHDAILTIDGAPIPADATREVMANRIRGAAGSAVTLSVRSPGAEPRDVVITRGEIATSSQLLIDTLPGDVFYARFPTVMGETDLQTFGQAYSAAAAAVQLRGVVLDLRVATGGSGGWPLAELLTVFSTGDLGEIYDRQEQQAISIAGEDIAGTQTIPLVVLVGPDTRQEPELFAQFLQANGRAQVFGLRTPGDTEAYITLALPDGSRLTLAARSYRDINGVDISTTGLTPANLVEVDWDAYLDSADPVLNAAVSALP